MKTKRSIFASESSSNVCLPVFSRCVSSPDKQLGFHNLQLTINDVLGSHGVSDNIISFIQDEENKKKLRLVNKVSRAAVDRTVTAVSWPYGVHITPEVDRPHDVIKYVANWKGLKKLNADCAGRLNLNVYDIDLLAFAGFTALESLTLVCDPLHIESARNVVAAGWKLKEFSICIQGPSSEWLDYVVKNGSWQVEKFGLTNINGINYTSDIVAVIAKSQWPIQSLHLKSCQLKASDINMLLGASWTSQLKELDVSDNWLRLESCQALVELTRKAVNLNALRLNKCLMSQSEFLVLATGKYDNLLSLDLFVSGEEEGIEEEEFLIAESSVPFSAMLALFEASPRLEDLKLEGYLIKVTELSEARRFASCLPALKSLRLNYVVFTVECHVYEPLPAGPAIALEQCAFPNLQYLGIVNVHDDDDPDESELGFCRDFSKQHWPALQRLLISDDGLSQLELLPEKLPCLKELRFTQITQETTHFLSQSIWPVLQKIELLRWHGESDEEEAFKATSELLNPGKLPALREMDLARLRFTRSERKKLKVKAKHLFGGQFHLNI